MSKGIRIRWELCLQDVIAQYKAGKGVHTIQKYLKEYYGLDISKSSIHNKLKKEGVKSHRAIRMAKLKLKRCDYHANKELIIELDKTKGHSYVAEQVGGTRSGIARVLRIWRRQEAKQNED
jgi:GTP-sensing pleiotropic transcriptional regulator CodY